MVKYEEHTDQLLKQAADERGFRIQIISDLGDLLRSNETPPFLKILIVLGFLVFTGISFVFSIFLIHVSVETIKGIDIDPLIYLIYGSIISFLVVLLMVMGGVLIIKSSSQEASLRLEENLSKTLNARVEN